MNLSEFLDRKLKRRGAQSRLAEALGVSKSTVTGWRQGGKPGFPTCLLMALYFDVAPEELFAIVGDAEYLKFYRRLFPDGAPPDIFALLPDPAHREIHRKLQAVLEANSEDAELVVSAIDMAVRQIEARALLERIKKEAEEQTDTGIATAFRTLVQDQGDQAPAKKSLKKKPKGP